MLVGTIGMVTLVGTANGIVVTGIVIRTVVTGIVEVGGRGIAIADGVI